MDRAILEWLNAEARGQQWRALVQVAAVGLVAVPLVIFAVPAVRGAARRSTGAVSAAVVTVAGLAVAVAVNYGIEHLYFRPRPYWVIPSVVALLPRDGDTSFMPWQVIVVAGASVGVALLSRTWALVSAGVTLLVMIGCVAVGQNYPSDTLAGVVVGAGFVGVLLPLRHRIVRVLDRRWNPEAIVSGERSTGRHLAVGPARLRPSEYRRSRRREGESQPRKGVRQDHLRPPIRTGRRR